MTLREREGKPQLPYAESLNNVLRLSQQEARRRKHNTVGIEHLFLGLIREEAVARVLNDHIIPEPATTPTSTKITVEQIRTAVEFIIGEGKKEVEGEIGLAPNAKKILDLAAKEASLTGSSEVNPIHLLIGVIDEGKSVAAGVLESFGISKEFIPILRKKSGSNPSA